MIKTIVNNEEKEIEQIRLNNNKYVDYIDEKIGGGNEYEGNLPINIKFIGKGLQNYKIYGNTVNGESVGDKTNNLLSVLPGDRTNKGITYENKNNLYMQIVGKSTDVYSQTAAKNIFLQAGTYYIRFFCDTAYKQNLFVLLRHSDNNKDIVNEFGDGTKFTLENDENIKIIIGVIQSNVEINTNIYVQIAKDIKPSAFEPYGYRVQVTINSNTTNIYLPHQIRKVGDDAEYIDYREQKQHRVRKNLLPNTATSQTINGVTFTVNNDKSITCNGTATETAAITINTIFSINSTKISGCPMGGSWSSFELDLLNINTNNVDVMDTGNGAVIQNENSYRVRIRIASGYTCNNLTFYPMICKADIEDDTYEPYIENTELDITIPALPTLSGTNTLSVETTVQPSKVYIKENLDYKRIFIATRSIENNFDNPYTFKSIDSKNSTLKNYRIYGNTVDGESVGDLVESGEHTGEYLLPVTINSNTTSIYLPHQIRKVGDDAEYIDYGEQKQHRVRKNLLENTATSQTINGVTFTVNSDKSVTCNGTASKLSFFSVGIVPEISCILNGCPQNGSASSYILRISDVATGDAVCNEDGKGAAVNISSPCICAIRIASGYTCDNLTFYPMIRKADIEDNTYEPYIENTEVDVTLPALSTPSGTNTLSFETTVQPSKMYIKGHIKEITS